MRGTSARHPVPRYVTSLNTAGDTVWWVGGVGGLHAMYQVQATRYLVYDTDATIW